MSSHYEALLAKANKTFERTALTNSLAFGYSQFTMFAVYGLIIWFAGNEVSNDRSTFEKTLKSFLAVLFAAMGLAQVGRLG